MSRLPVCTAFRFLKANLFECSLPVKLTFSVTGRCQSRCLHCSIWKQSQDASSELSLSEIEKIFQEYPHFNWVDLTGGEVFLRKDFVELCEVIDSRSKRLEFLHFATNGLVSDTFDRIKEIRRRVKAKIVITLSIDGDRELNDKLRGVPGSYDKQAKIFSNIARSGMSGLEAYVGLTLSRHNYDKLEDIYKALKSDLYGFSEDKLHVNFLHNSFFYENLSTENSSEDGDGFALDKELSAKVLAQLDMFKHRGLFGIVEAMYRKDYLRYMEGGLCPRPCRSGEVSLYLDCRGVLRPCTMWNVRGIDLRENDLSVKKAISSEEFKKYLGLIRAEKCSHCWTPCEAYQTILSGLRHGL